MPALQRVCMDKVPTDSIPCYDRQASTHTRIMRAHTMTNVFTPIISSTAEIRPKTPAVDRIVNTPGSKLKSATKAVIENNKEKVWFLLFCLSRKLMHSLPSLLKVASGSIFLGRTFY